MGSLIQTIINLTSRASNKTTALALLFLVGVYVFINIFLPWLNS